jgi:hypothetical protein
LSLITKNTLRGNVPLHTAGPSDERNRVVTGLAVGLGIKGGLWLLQLLLLACLWWRLKNE